MADSGLQSAGPWHQRTWIIIALLIIFFPVGIYLVFKNPRWGKFAKGAILTSFVGLLTVAVIFTPPTIAIKSSTQPIEGETYKIEGEVSPESAIVTVAGKVANKSGAKFTIEVTLKEGDNTFVVVAQDGDKRTEESFTIHRFTKEEIAKRKAEEEAKRKKAEEEKARKAEEAAKVEAEKKAKEEAEAKKKAEDEAAAQAAAAASAKAQQQATVQTAPASATSSGSSVYYANCTAVRAAGAAPIYSGQPGYRAALDRDRDGVACE